MFAHLNILPMTNFIIYTFYFLLYEFKCSLGFVVLFRLVSNSPSYCLNPPTARIKDIHHYVWQRVYIANANVLAFKKYIPQSGAYVFIFCVKTFDE